MGQIQSMQSLLIAHLAFKKNVETNLIKYGFKPGNPRTLLYIADHEGCMQKDLAETFYVESSTLSSVLTNMEESGFIERRRSEKDKRSYAIYMTPKGRHISETVRKQFDDTIETALSGFSQKEAAQLHDYLERVADNLKKANAHKQ